MSVYNGNRKFNYLEIFLIASETIGICDRGGLVRFAALLLLLLCTCKMQIRRVIATRRDFDAPERKHKMTDWCMQIALRLYVIWLNVRC